MEIAIEKLDLSLNMIKTERLRYLESVLIITDRLESDFTPVVLKGRQMGGDAEELVIALIELRNARVLTKNALKRTAELRTFCDIDNLQYKELEKQATNAQAVGLLRLKAKYCADFPVLHKFSDTINLPLRADSSSFALEIQNGHMYYVTEDVRLSLDSFTLELLSILSDAESAALTLKKDLKKADVWEYPILISAALDALYYDEFSFVGRAAAEKLAESQYEWCNNVSSVLGGASVLFVMCGL